MSTVFGHVKIISTDWLRLSRFYQEVFVCVQAEVKNKLETLNSDQVIGGSRLAQRE